MLLRCGFAVGRLCLTVAAYQGCTWFLPMYGHAVNYLVSNGVTCCLPVCCKRRPFTCQKTAFGVPICGLLFGERPSLEMRRAFFHTNICIFFGVWKILGTFAFANSGLQNLV